MKHKTHAVAASGGGKDEATDSMQTLKNRTIKMERRREEEANIITEKRRCWNAGRTRCKEQEQRQRDKIKRWVLPTSLLQTQSERTHAQRTTVQVNNLTNSMHTRRGRTTGGSDFRREGRGLKNKIKEGADQDRKKENRRALTMQEQQHQGERKGEKKHRRMGRPESKM